MTKHTPGPWEVVSGTTNCGPYVRCIRGDVADCYTMDRTGRNARPIPFQGEEAEANARLISAAPDMLEALKLARKYVADLPILGDDDLAVVDAAIAKATGNE